jgi:hypothetical protein
MHGSKDWCDGESEKILTFHVHLIKAWVALAAAWPEDDSMHACMHASRHELVAGSLGQAAAPLLQSHSSPPVLSTRAIGGGCTSANCHGLLSTDGATATGQLHAAMDSFAMIDLLVRNLDLPVIWIPGPRQVKPTEQQLYCTCPCKSNCVGECVSLITTTATLHVLFRRSTILQFFFSCLTAAPSSFLGLADESFSDVQSIPVLCSLEPWTLDYSSVNSAVWDLFNYCQHCT